MQIIPTSAGSIESLWSSDATTGGKSAFAEFFDAVHNAINDVQSGNSVSATAAMGENMEAQAIPQVQSPYSRTTTNGVTYTLDEVCFTKQELQDLRRALVKAGATEDSLKKFDVLADQPDGATLAQIMASLQHMGSTPALSDDDKTNITSLLKKIDPSGILDDHAQQLMAKGQGREAMGAIAAFVNNLDATAVLDISRAEAVSLGRGLGLDSSALRSLAGSFGPYDTLSCPMGQLSSLLTPVTDFFASQRTAQQKLDAALQETLQPMISKARARTEKEKLASALRNREAQQSKVLIDRTVQKNIRAVLDQTLQAGQAHGRDSGELQSSAVSRQLDGSQSAGIGHAGSGGNKTSVEQNTGQKNTLREAQAAAASAAAHTEGATNSQSVPHQGKNAESRAPAMAEAQHESGSRRESQTGERQNKNGDTSWTDTVRRADVQSVVGARSNDSIIYSMLQGATDVDAASAVTEAATPPMARQVAQQVRQGMLSGLRSGGTRLDLQLHPQELGSLAITLTLRNGEVSATIRSEKTETAEMVNRQLDSIRINLEQQGIKVDKIEVQLNANQQDDNGWQNLDQHNARQEEDARRDELARLKNLATARNLNENSGDSVLEQTVHSLPQTEIYATRALNVVA